MMSKQYDVHPLAKLFPPVEGQAFTDLVEDIKKNGLVNPIVVDGNLLLDGRNRLRACKAAGVSPRFVTFTSLGLKVSPVDYIWSTNVNRRHLTADQRAILSHEWTLLLAEDARKRQVAALKKGNKVVQMKSKSAKPAKPNATRRAVAERAQVTMHKVQQVELVTKHAPQLAKKVASGEMKLKDAAKIAHKNLPKRKLKRHVANPLTPYQAATKIMDGVNADTKNILHRVADREAFFSTLNDHFTVWCKRMLRKASKAA